MNLRELKNCRICGKVHLHHGGIVVCEVCRKDLDDIYIKARDILRDKRNAEEFDSIRLAEEIGVDPIYIHILVEGGYFERDGFDLDGTVSARKNLARSFEAELNKKKRNDHEKKTSSRGMFYDERRDKDKDR
ncbi:MAG: Uncharacterized protein XD80_0413 [Synergistales bacterium 53_16]|jgi:hypothetical protein|nr:MAG: Uncharacterized protein XD80_0413 [Synergistales bacterium 53_16]MDN5335027.1 hypothetical protein [Synergistales bacterium]